MGIFLPGKASHVWLSMLRESGEKAMKLSGNTVLVTGGGSGIGRGLAEALHKAGSQVIIAGRRKGLLEQVAAASRNQAGAQLHWIELDMEDPANIAEVAAKLVRDFPALNVLVNNAGIMRATVAGAGPIEEGDLLSTVTTNLLGPIRLTGALLPHLKTKNDAVLINVTSGLGFVPLTPVSVYCATKAALHSYTLSLRFDLRDSGVDVLELIPPYVQTELFHGAEDPRAMPLAEFIAETMALLATDAREIRVERAKMLRSDEGAEKEHAAVTRFNEMMAGDPH